MDHLPIPPNSGVGPFPYLGLTTVYDLEGFDGFPSRHGFTIPQILSMGRPDFAPVVTKGNTIIQTADEMESFLQEWLYFGILHEFGIYCRQPLDIYDFIILRDDTDGPVLTTEPLIRYVQDLAIRQLQHHNVPLDLQVGDTVIFDLPSLFKSTINPVFNIAKDHGNLRYSISSKDDPEQKEESIPIAAAYLRRLSPTSPGSSRQGEGKGLILKEMTRTMQYKAQALYTNLGLVHPSREPPGELLSQLRIARALRDASSMLSRLIQTPDPILQLRNGLAIALLFQALTSVMSRIFNEDVGLNHDTAVLNFDLEEGMKARHWCPAAIQNSIFLSLEAGFLASCLQTSDSRHHGDCSVSFCAYRKHRLGNQSPSHYSRICAGTCQMKIFNGEKLLSLLRSKKIPGIRQCHLENGETDYRIEDATSQRYVAISHVWSHGLGNSFQNGLWLCQLKNLFEKLNLLGEGGALLWIDTILVPQAEEHKRLALPTMKDVYSRATKVLVVDAQLSEVGPHPIEQRLQLLSSEWMTRLWTLQEARLASKLYVQFREGPVGMEELLRETPPDDDEKSVFYDFYLSTSGRLATVSTNKPAGPGKFLDVAQSMAVRSATLVTDEPIVLSTLLDLDFLPTGQIPKMEDILLSLTEIPMDFLFLPTRRLSRSGLRWAPETLLELGPSSLGANSENATRTEKGLCLRSDCAILDTYFDSKKFFEAPDHIYCIICDDKETFAFTELGRPPPIIQPLSKSAVLFQKQGSMFSRTSVAVLVSIDATTEDTLTCRFVMHLKAWRISPGQTDTDSSFQAPSQRGKHTFSGKFLRRQSFCVD